MDYLTGPGHLGLGLQESVGKSSQMGHHLLATHILKTPAYPCPALPGGPLSPPNSVPRCTITAGITIPSGIYVQARSPCSLPLTPPWLSSRTRFPKAETATGH